MLTVHLQSTCYKTFPVIGVSMAKVNDYSEHLQVSIRSGHSAGHLIHMNPCSISDILPKLEPLLISLSLRGQKFLQKSEGPWSLPLHFTQ